MQQWEHKTVYNTFLADEKMDEYGKDGWRLSARNFTAITSREEVRGSGRPEPMRLNF